jgi:NitT/TauT family transport system substrate-binding protein
MFRTPKSWLVLGLFSLTALGCGGGKQPAAGGGSGSGSTAADSTEAPTFSLAWSEYPSWSVFGVAQRRGLIDGAAGKLGPIEEKWNVDIELKQNDYDPCLQLYATDACDAVCITNIDILSPSISRPGVAILPTSTSDGADACIVIDIDDTDKLRDHKVFGLAKTVSEYCFHRCLEKAGKQPSDYQFSNSDPAAAALGMQQKNAEFQAIMVWNPYVLQTLRTREGAKVLFDSEDIPGEIIDMVVVGENSIKKPGGEAFCKALADCYYEMNKIIEAPDTRDEALVQIGEDFSDLKLEDMKVVVDQTKFYKTPAEGIAVYEGSELPKTMETVLATCKKLEMVEGDPIIAFGAAKEGEKPNVRFDASYMKAVQEAAAK